MIRKTKKLLTFLCATLAVTAAAVGVGAGMQQTQPVVVGAEVVDSVVKTTYVKGDEFVLPASVTIEADGVSYETTKSYLVYPDGKASSASKFILNDCGKYKTVFETTVDGTRYTAEKEFTVEESIYSVKMPASSYRYGKLNDNFDDVWGYTDGMLVDLAEGDTFTYNRSFNIYEEDTSNMFVFNLMTMGTDLSIGTATIRLTDCYDPTNYMEILYMRLYKNELYFRAGISGQATVGVYSKGPYDGYVTIDDTTYVYMINKSGTMLPTNYDQDTVGPNATPYNNDLRIYLDMSDPEHIKVRGATDKYAFDRLITEINNETMYSYHWDGFTTGDVYLSLSASNFNGRETAPFEIARIMDTYGEALKPVINKDNTAPTILLDREGSGATIVKGVPVSVPNATARDISGVAGSVKCAVYYAYGTSFQSAVPLVNNTFIPNNYGDYTVVYKAWDIYNNEAEATYVLMASVEAAEGISFTAPDFTGLKAGQSIKLGGYEVSGYNGDVSVAMTLTNPKGETKEYDGETSIFLARAGEYVATYIYKDAAYSYEKAIKIDVADGGVVDFQTDIAVPNYFIKNASYTIEGAEAYKYTAADPKRVDTTCYVSFDGKEYVECNAQEVKIEAEETVRVKFVCKDDESVVMESAVVPVVDTGIGGVLSIGEYFVGDFEYEVNPSFVAYMSNAAGDATLNFVNPISFNNFYFGFSLIEANSIKDITLTLTDFYDRSNVLTLRLTKDKANKGHIYINEKTDLLLTQDYAAGSNVYVNYANGMITLNSIDQVEFADPFTFDKCLFSVTLHDVEEGEGINVTMLCNQSFGMLYKDTATPMISVVAPVRVGQIGGVFTVNTPAVTDVLTPILAKNVNVTVYYNKLPMTAMDGTVLNKVDALSRTYDVATENYGDYLISYFISDGSKSLTHREEVRVIDREAPVLVLNTKHAEAQVGMVIPEIDFTVSDNMSDVSKIEVWQIVFDRELVVVGCAPVGSADVTIAIFNAGEYTVWVWCIDETGNSTYQTYTLTVK